MDNRQKIFDVRYRRLKRLVQEMFTGHQTRFAEAIDRKNTYVNFLLTDPDKAHHKNLGGDLARHIENRLGLPFGWLDREDDESHLKRKVVPVDDLPPEGFVFVPRRHVRLSAGNGTMAFDEEQAPPLAFRQEWLTRNGLRAENLAVVEASGDSMLPRIHDGDTLLIDTSSRIARDGQVYAIRNGDELRVKRIYRRVRGVLLHSDNPAYPPEELNEEEAAALDILGRVVWVSGGI